MFLPRFLIFIADIFLPPQKRDNMNRKFDFAAHFEYNTLMRHYKFRIIGCAVLLFLFAVTAILTLNGTLADFESEVYRLISGTRSSGLTTAMKILTALGDWYVLTAAPIILFILPKTRKKLALPITATLLVSGAVNNILKIIFRRVRPPVLQLVSESGFSFPSGHTQNSAAFFIALAIILLVGFKNRKITIPAAALCALFPLLIGFTRVYLGVHYAGDVLAGFLLGAGIAAGVSCLWGLLDKKTKNSTMRHWLFFDQDPPDTL